MHLLNKIKEKIINTYVKNNIEHLIAKLEKESLLYKSGSPYFKKCRDKIVVLEELAARMKIKLD